MRKEEGRKEAGSRVQIEDASEKMKSKFQIAGMVALAMLAGMLAEPALAQRGRGQRQQNKRPAAEKAPQPQQQVTPPAGQQQGAGGQGGPGKAFMPGRGPGAGGMPPQWLDRLHQMSPQDQERFMNNNQRFRNLPPERQTEIRDRLRRWNAMTPEQRRRIVEIDKNLRNLPPEERLRLREEVIPKLQQMDPLRRQAIMRRVRALEGMSEEERAARLKDETFLQGLSAEEKAMLHDVVRFRIGAGPPPEPPQDNPPLD